MPDEDIPLRLDVWEKADSGWQWVVDVDPNAERNPLMSLAVESRWNSPGPWSLTAPFDALGWVDENHLLTCDFRDTRETLVPEAGKEYLGDDGLPLADLSGTTALSLLGDARGWPVPSELVADQTSVRWYAEGPAEDVLTDFLQANLVGRLGYDLVVLPSQGRGLQVTVNSEFDAMLETVTQLATLGGITLRAGLVNRPDTRTRADLAVWFEEPVDRTAEAVFSAEAGSLRAYSRSWSIPTATRAIVQAAKESQGREVSSVSIATNRVNLKAKESKLRTGDIITFTAGTPPTPLEVGVPYHAVRIDKDTFEVAMSRADASAGLIVDLTDVGAGKITVTESTRRHRQVVDEATEADWWRVREVFVEGEGEDKNRALDQAGAEAVSEGAAQFAVELETAEVPGMRYGDPISLGDFVLYATPSGSYLTERVGAVKTTLGEGLVVQMVLGDPEATSTDARLAKVIRRIKRKTAKKARED